MNRERRERERPAREQPADGHRWGPGAGLSAARHGVATLWWRGRCSVGIVLVRVGEQLLGASQAASGGTQAQVGRAGSPR
jgi:hypothetical protein